MRWALRPWLSQLRIVARWGSQSLDRPTPIGVLETVSIASDPMGAMAGFESIGVSIDPMGAMAGFELSFGSADPTGAMAGFDAACPRFRYRPTVSRLRPSSRAIRRCDQPRWCRVKMLSLIAILSRF